MVEIDSWVDQYVQSLRDTFGERTWFIDLHCELVVKSGFVKEIKVDEAKKRFDCC